MSKQHSNTTPRREIIDTAVHAFGSPHFDAEKAIAEIYAKCDTKDGSILAVLNALPTLAEAAKKLY